MHTVPFEGSVGLVNMLTMTRINRKGFDTSLVLYGPGSLMASAARGYPTVGDEAFPGALGYNKQLQTFMNEGGHVYACRFSAAMLYGMREIDMMEGVKRAGHEPLSAADCGRGQCRSAGRIDSHQPGRCRHRHRCSSTMGGVALITPAESHLDRRSGQSYRDRLSVRIGACVIPVENRTFAMEQRSKPSPKTPMPCWTIRATGRRGWAVTPSPAQRGTCQVASPKTVRTRPMTTTLIWLSGGTTGQTYLLRNRITTARRPRGRSHHRDQDQGALRWA